MVTTDTSALHERADLENDLSRLVQHGPDQLDIVAFADLDDMGPPLNVSERLRNQVYDMVMADLQGRIDHLHHRIHGYPLLRVAR